MLTAEEYGHTVRLLRGRRIHRVVYYALTSGDDGEDVEEWDFGVWHQPTMGVELVTDDGGCFSAVWGWSFDHFGLEVFAEPMTAHLGMSGSVAVEVTEHPCWAGLVGRKLAQVGVAWFDGVPLAVRLGSRERVVWMAVGSPAEEVLPGGFRLGTDDVMVVFSAEVAAEVGITRADTWS